MEHTNHRLKLCIVDRLTSLWTWLQVGYDGKKYQDFCFIRNQIAIWDSMRFRGNFPPKDNPFQQKMLQASLMLVSFQFDINIVQFDQLGINSH